MVCIADKFNSVVCLKEFMRTVDFLFYHILELIIFFESVSMLLAILSVFAAVLAFIEGKIPRTL